MANNMAADGNAAAGLRLLPLWLFLMSLPAITWMLAEGQLVLRADLTSALARKNVGLWVSGQRELPTAQKWRQAEQQLQAALNLMPGQADYHEALADAFMVAGRMEWANEPLRRQRFQRAAAGYRAAIELRPGDAHTWAALAASLAAAGERGTAVPAAWAKALVLGPNEGHVQPMLMHTAMVTWADASPAMQQWVVAQYENGTATQRKAINQMGSSFGLYFESDQPPKR